MSLESKVVLITGGSRGLGFVLAQQLHQRGAKLAICARDDAELERAKNELRFASADVLAVQCDVTSQPQVNGMIEGIIRHYGHLDVLINNAGVISIGPVETMTFADYAEAMNLHFYAPLFTTLAVLPHMKRRQSGRIVNISSIGGLIPTPHLVPYNASKFALAGFSQGLRTELLKDNIYVTSVFPGLMRTGSPRNAFFKGRNQEEYAWFKISDSLPGMSISAERAARQIINAFMHGQATLTISLQAKLASTIQALLPDLVTDLGAIINHFLPQPGGIGSRRARGAQSESEGTQTKLTALTDQAAAAYNEIQR